MAELAFRETRFRSILKGLSWRMIATTTTGIIAYGVTGSIKPALAIGGVEFICKFFLYYIHERAWQSLPRGSFRGFVHRSKNSNSYDPGI